MSMLKSFFEIGSDKGLFDGLTFGDAYDMLRQILRAEMFRLSFLADSERIPEKEKSAFRRFLDEKETREDVSESGEGFSHILIEPEDPDAGIVIEVKYAASIAGLDVACRKAMEQIKSRKYDERLRGDGEEGIRT